MPDWAVYQSFTLLSLFAVPAVMCLDVLMFAFYYALRRLCSLPLPRASTLVTLLVIHVFLYHPRGTQLALMNFDCWLFDVQRLMYDPDIICRSQEFALWQALGGLAFVMCAFGIPLTLGVMLYRYRSRLQEADTVRLFGFLYNGYEPAKYYFEVVFMIRKALFFSVQPLTTVSKELGNLAQSQTLGYADYGY